MQALWQQQDIPLNDTAVHAMVDEICRVAVCSSVHSRQRPHTVRVERPHTLHTAYNNTTFLHTSELAESQLAPPVLFYRHNRCPQASFDRYTASDVVPRAQPAHRSTALSS